MNKLSLAVIASLALTVLHGAVYPVPKSTIPTGGSVDVSNIKIDASVDSKIPDEGYTLEITKSGKAIIKYLNEDGLFYALKTFEALKASAKDGKIECCKIYDAPQIALRGVVEGYYGRPWGTKGRESLLKFMGSVKMNTFIYGPKDDPYHHKSWRKSYPDAAKADFKRLLEVAKANHIDFHWAIHLGGNFALKGENRQNDYKLLFAKLGEMYDLGIRSFAVFFDDFGDRRASAHAEICNRVIKEFINVKPGCTRLIVCPHVYWGLGSEYISTLGKELDKSAHIMWTGEKVCRDIPSSHVEKITKSQGRAPFLWWNWPVNDYCRKKLLIGRTYGLEGTKLSGFVTNPMENCEANKIGIFGCADWSWNPESFDSQKNWEASFADIFDNEETARAMKVLADHNSDPDRNGWDFRREESVGAKEKCPKQLFSEIVEAMKILENNLPKENSDLWFEIEGWVKCQRYLAEMGLEALKKTDADIKTIAKLRKAYLESQNAHVAKFKAKTFGADAGRVKKPEPSTVVIVPMVEKLVEEAFKSRWEAKTGRKYVRAEGFEGISTAKGFAKPVVTRDFKYAGFGPVFEPIVLAPQETIGVKLPKDWVSEYVNVNVSSSKGLALEISADGITWQKMEEFKKGPQLRKKIAKGVKCSYVRLRNDSNAEVKFKLEVLEFFVMGEYSPVDLIISDLI